MDDIPLLVNFYVKKISKRIGKAIVIISTRVMNALQNYHWPGNVRELKNVLERAVINSSGPKLRLVDEATRIYRDSYGQDPAFYAFFKTLETYKGAAYKNAFVILGTDSDYYRFLKTIPK